jgi:hypothetical protein
MRKYYDFSKKACEERWNNMTDEQRKKLTRMRGLLKSGKMKILPCSQKKTKKLQPYLKTILKIIGHPEAWTTDESILGHFCVTKTVLKKLSKLGIVCDESSLLIDMAAALRDLENDE